MTIKDMQLGLSFMNKVYEEEGDELANVENLFGNLKLGDTGTVKMILKSELEYCKKGRYENAKQLQEHIESLSLVNKFCLIPYPSDVKHEHGEDYLIFIRYDLAGTRGEEKNIVVDVKYFLDMQKKDFYIEFVKEN